MSIFDRLEQARNGVMLESTASANEGTSSSIPVITDKYQDLKKKLQNDIIEQFNRTGNDADVDLKSVIQSAVNAESLDIPRTDRLRIIQEIYDEVAGLGPLESLMKDPSVTEIMVNGSKNIYVERKGRLEQVSVAFEDDAHVLKIIDRIVSRIGRRCDESNPMVDARLLDGSRVNAVIPPIALKGPSITIRRFNSAPLSIGNLVENNSVSYAMASFLESCVKGKANIVVAGGTGSGKTTLLNILSGFIPETERIVTIEDAAELQLKQNHVVTLESRPANAEGAGAITIRELVRNALRMRPDRIIVGEVRSGETLDMLQAMNTGHEGSLTTVHANSPRDVLSRLETMVLMSGMELPLKAIRDQVASAIDIIVYQTRFRDGTRKVTNIAEVLGMEGDIITLQDIFTFKPEGLDSNGKIKGRYLATGIRPQIVEKFKNSGVMVRDEWFK